MSTHARIEKERTMHVPPTKIVEATSVWCQKAVRTEKERTMHIPPTRFVEASARGMHPRDVGLHTDVTRRLQLSLHERVVNNNWMNDAKAGEFNCCGRLRREHSTECDQFEHN